MASIRHSQVSREPPSDNSAERVRSTILHGEELYRELEGGLQAQDRASKNPIIS